jgi:signal transduction histidine kinase
MTDSEADIVRRLEAMGVLTRSATHDLNNHIAAMLTFLELVLESLPTDHPTREDIEEIRASGERAIARTRELDRISRELSPIAKAA